MKLRIVSDGTYSGTRVYTEAGEFLENVTALEIRIRPGGRMEAKLTVIELELDLIAERLPEEAEA